MQAMRRTSLAWQHCSCGCYQTCSACCRSVAGPRRCGCYQTCSACCRSVAGPRRWKLLLSSCLSVSTGPRRWKLLLSSCLSVSRNGSLSLSHSAQDRPSFGNPDMEIPKYQTKHRVLVKLNCTGLQSEVQSNREQNYDMFPDSSPQEIYDSAFSGKDAAETGE